MMIEKPYIVASFYLFTPFQSPMDFKQALLNKFVESNCKGTVILAHEGINGSIAGHQDDIHVMMDAIRALPGCEALHFLINYHDKNPFMRSKVKIRKEIVTIGDVSVDPTTGVGTYLNPEEWNALLMEEDVVVIDTRNKYEVELGTFKGAIDPKTINFRDFPDYVDKVLKQHKDKKIAMCCTGGIRCEKSTAYLLQQGFKDVYHLKGGILTYLETMPKETSLWEGSCFVFDDRVAVDADLNALPDGSIDKEWKNKYREKEI
jgi:UPF0176 protein